MTSQPTTFEETAELDDEIPFFRPHISEDEQQRALAVLQSGWLTSGPNVREFEERFADAVDAAHAIALNSATAALHLSLVAHDIGPGDEVIVPTMTFASGGEVVIATGATPVLVDVLPDTLAIDPAAVRAAMSSRTRAIMPMHYGGLSCDLPSLREIAGEGSSRALILDDAAHAFPATLDGLPVGGLTDGTSFSFYANKTMTTGEGGMFTCNDEDVAARVRRLSLHGLSRDAWNRFDTRSKWDYDIQEAGWKYNLTDIAAAIGLGQLSRAHEMAELRRAAADRYDAAFAHIAGLSPVSPGSRHSSACHLYVIRVDDAVFGSDRDDVIAALQAAGIGSSVHYRPLHMHSYYRGCGLREADFPVATAAFSQIVSLPLFPGITEREIDRVLETITALGTS